MARNSTNEKECRRIVYERSEGVCEICCMAPAQSVHHRRKRSHGGPWTAANCIHICGDGTRGCHGWIEANPKKAHDRGYWVWSWEDERAMPILLWGDWVLLQEDGSKIKTTEREFE
ncbi:HNH endonuclease [Gordonia phage Trax]|uniref:HNH endonuclease n=1 Tax=Gordonia phage Trax TaxID=2591121 RepID=A0A515MGZ9_9CAUD|nr:HNH endonuclease [Gordonia phage Trax]QDM55958.1 HNH endonuclease [Gordonia phage Trax]